MSIEALVVAPVLVAGVLAFGGGAKLGDSDDAARQEWADLGVPGPLNTRGMRGVHPWAELVLGAALLVAPGALSVVAAAAAALLCAVYLVLIVRAASGPDLVPCGCFGAKDRIPITVRTVVRNVVLLALALLALVHAIDVGSVVDALRDASTATWWWLLAAAVVGVTVHLFAPSPAAPREPADVAAPMSQPASAAEDGHHE